MLATGVGAAVGGIAVAVGGAAVAVGGTVVAVGGTGVADGGTGVGTGVGVGAGAHAARTINATIIIAMKRTCFIFLLLQRNKDCVKNRMPINPSMLS
jgi:hypothetical protein